MILVGRHVSVLDEERDEDEEEAGAIVAVPKETEKMVVVKERDDVQCSGSQGLNGDSHPVTYLVGKKRSDLGNQTSVLMHFYISNRDSSKIIALHW
jgi:hypothetical protein